MNSDNTRSSAGFSIIPTNEKNQRKLKNSRSCVLVRLKLSGENRKKSLCTIDIKKQVYFYSTNTEAETVHFVWL